MMSETLNAAASDEPAISILCRGISDENKFARKASLCKIHAYLSELGEDAVPEAFESIFMKLLEAFSDPSEGCREKAVKVVMDFIPKTFSIEPHVTSIITVLGKRISGDGKQEPAEEIRLLLIHLLIVVLKKAHGCNLVPHLNDLCKIVCASLKDNYPDVKVASCECTKILAETSQAFHVQSETYLDALKHGIVHKHSKVRVAYVTAIGLVVRYGTHNLVEKVAHLLGERLYDSSPAVRKEVVSIGGDWLCNLPNRYSHFCRIIPLVVTGIDDEMPEVRNFASLVWNKAGAQYAEENEETLKDELDYSLDSLPVYPIEVPRPNVGCRALMKRESTKMLPAILKELSDWNAGVRMQSASLLFQLVRHLESNNIQHLQRLWPDISIKCADLSEPEMKYKIDQSIQLLGYFTPIDALLEVALPQEELSLCQLCCLAAAMKGVPSLKEPCILTLCQALSKTVNTNMELQYQMALMDCAKSILDAVKRQKDGGTSWSKESTLSMFSIALNLLGNSQSPEFNLYAKEILHELANSSGIDPSELFKQHGTDILTPLLATVPLWTEHSAYKNIFLAFVKGAGPGIGPHLPAVAQILISWGKVASSGTDLADMVRIAMPILSWRFLENCTSDPESFLETILNNLIKPNLKWSAGRIAEVRRSQALVLLTIAISEPEVPDEIIAKMVVDFPPLLTLMLEETSKDPRLGAGRALEILCRRWRKLDMLDFDATFKIVKVAAERLDDVKLEVRLQALEVLKSALPSEVPPNYTSHIELLYKTALIHLDDQDSNYSLAVLNTLKVIGLIDVALITKLLNACRTKFTNQGKCDELLQYFQKHHSLN